MQAVYDAFAPLAPFFSVLFPLVMPAVISMVTRIKADLIAGGPAWSVWLVSLLLGVLMTHATALVLGRAGLIVPDTMSTTIFGILVGLAASGLVDVSKLIGGRQ